MMMCYDLLNLQKARMQLISMQNKKIFSSNITINGFSFNRITDKESVFFAKNEINCDCIKEKLNEKQLEAVYDFFEIDDFCNIDLQNLEFEISRYLSKNASIIDFFLNIKADMKKNCIFNLDVPMMKKNTAFFLAEMNVLLSFPNRPLFIKQEFRLDIREDIVQQVVNRLNHLIKQYEPFFEIPVMKLGGDIFDLILPAGKGGILIHETLGHALEADLFFSGKNILEYKMGQKIFNSDIFIFDESFHDLSLGICSDDGVIKQRVSLIENGSIVGLLTDSKSSLRYGLKNTGNGRQESYRHPVLPRMCNTFLGCGRYKKDEIIDTTKNGVYALDIGGGHVDISTGEFVFNIFAGMYIKNGKHRCTRGTNEIK